MPTDYKDRVMFRAAAAGDAPFVVGSAITGYQLPSVLINGFDVYYLAESDDKTEWEIGYGSWDNGTSTISKYFNYSSSLGGGDITFTDPPKVSIVAPAIFFYTLQARLDATATTTNASFVELATDSEAQGFSDSTRALTPSNLAAIRASQAEQETGTALDRFVPTGRQHNHPSAVKCHGFTTGAGTPVLHANSYNVTSITDTATGRLTVTIGTDFSSANWTGVASCTCATNANRMVSLVSKAAGSVILESSSAATTLADPGTGWDWMFGGDQ